MDCTCSQGYDVRSGIIVDRTCTPAQCYRQCYANKLGIILCSFHGGRLRNTCEKVI